MDGRNEAGEAGADEAGKRRKAEESTVSDLNFCGKIGIYMDKNLPIHGRFDGFFFALAASSVDDFQTSAGSMTNDGMG